MHTIAAMLLAEALFIEGENVSALEGRSIMCLHWDVLIYVKVVEILLTKKNPS